MYEGTSSLAGSLRRESSADQDPWVELRDDASLDAHRSSREQQRWERSIDIGSATWIGLLLTLSERRANVAVKLAFNVIVRGHITLVGSDVVGISTANEFVAVAISAIVHLECDASSGYPDRENTDSPGTQHDTLHAMLQRSAEARDPVALIIHGNSTEVFGQLRACGQDICTLTFTSIADASTKARRYVYIPTNAIVGFRMARLVRP